MKNTDVFAVIGDPTRRKILTLLKEQEVTVNDLVEQIDASQPTVSKHLAILRNADLVTTQSQGRHRYYSLHGEALHPITEFTTTLLGTSEAISADTVLNHQDASDTETPKNSRFTSKFSLRHWNKLRKDS